MYIKLSCLRVLDTMGGGKKVQLFVLPMTHPKRRASENVNCYSFAKKSLSSLIDLPST